MDSHNNLTGVYLDTEPILIYWMGPEVLYSACMVVERKVVQVVGTVVSVVGVAGVADSEIVEAAETVA